MTFKLTLTTPEVENKTTNTVKIRDVNIAGLLEGNGPVAVVGIVEGELSGEVFTEHRSRSFRIEKAVLDVELAKTVTGTDTTQQAIERAILNALVAGGHLATGSIS